MSQRLQKLGAKKLHLVSAATNHTSHQITKRSFIASKLEVERAKNPAGSRRDEPKSCLKMARRAETSFFQVSEWREETRRDLARAKRAKNEPN